MQIDILSIEPRQNWGYTRIRPLVGTLPEDFPITKMWHSLIDRQRGVATLPIGIEIELAPFFGVMGVAPRPVYGACSSIQPREFGGNMDLKELVAGTTLYLPVWAPGALFSVGDGHGVQGDGEVCITALETALSGSFRLTVRKDLGFKLPRAETPTHYITMAFNEDLDDAAKDALRAMIDLIGERMGLSREDAYMFASLAVDMRVTQLVDGNKGIHAMLPKHFARSLMRLGLSADARRPARGRYRGRACRGGGRARRGPGPGGGARPGLRRAELRPLPCDRAFGRKPARQGAAVPHLARTLPGRDSERGSGRGHPHRAQEMPQFDDLDTEQIDDLIAYLKSLEK